MIQSEETTVSVLRESEGEIMDYKEAIELAYNNGYKQGAKELKSRCMRYGIYPALVDAKANEILAEMTEGKSK